VFPFTNPVRFLLHLFFSLLAALSLGGCSPAQVLLVPASPQAAQDEQRHLMVHEYPITEQSVDNPDHRGFLDRVSAVVGTQHNGLFTASAQDQLAAPNRALTRFGFHLTQNPYPPLSSFALYQADTLLVGDISHFWPVSYISNGKDFILPFETLDGAALVASVNGVQGAPGESQDDNTRAAPPGYSADRVAYTAVSAELLDIRTYAAPEGNAFKQSQDSAEVYYSQWFGGNLLDVYPQDGQIHLSYAGRDLAYVYDQVVHNQTGDLAVFNPGGNNAIFWFLALRDGVWYYVEIEG
jgi:hypothetical protein